MNVNKPFKYFRYVRKSTRGEEKQVLSIESQREELDRFVQERGFSVVDEFEERESAYSTGRPVFAEMMRRIASGDANGIIAWHPDRLARNSKDGGEILHLIDTGVLADVKFPTFWFENTPQGRANLGHELVQTKQYSDKLGCDTKRGLEKKARMGIRPGLAPLGYLNDKATKTVVVDPGLAPIVKQAFELYAQGDKTLEMIRDFLLNQGVRSKKTHAKDRGGLPIHPDRVRRILSNPFYYGHFNYGGELYEGKQAPIITKQLFDKVQAVLNRRSPPKNPERVAKAFLGLFRCGECGMAVTAEIQKGHTYYRCTRKSKSKRCRQPFAREETLDRQLTDLLLPFGLRSDWAGEMLKMVEAERRESAMSSRNLVHEKQTELAKLDAKAQRLLDTYLEQLIERDEFTAQKAEILDQKKTLKSQIELFGKNRKPWLEPLQKWIKTAEMLEKTVKTGSLTEKKELAGKVFGSNLFLDSKKARGYATKPWSFLPEIVSSGGMVRMAGIEATKPPCRFSQTFVSLRVDGSLLRFARFGMVWLFGKKAQLYEGLLSLIVTKKGRRDSHQLRSLCPVSPGWGFSTARLFHRVRQTCGGVLRHSPWLRCGATIRPVAFGYVQARRHSLAGESCNGLRHVARALCPL